MPACLLIAEASLLFGQHGMQLQEPLILVVSQPSCSVLAQLLLGMDLLQHRQAHKVSAAVALTCTQLLLPWKLVPSKNLITKMLVVLASCQQPAALCMHQLMHCLPPVGSEDCTWRH